MDVNRNVRVIRKENREVRGSLVSKRFECSLGLCIGLVLKMSYGRSMPVITYFLFSSNGHKQHFCFTACAGIFISKLIGV